MTIVQILRYAVMALALTQGICGAGAVSPAAAETTATAASLESAYGLIRRVLPAHVDGFVCEVIAAESGRDVFEYEAGPAGKIILRGNNGVALAVAFNQYLRHEARLSYDWQATGPLVFHGALPQPVARVRHSCAAAERFFLNYCTFGYTTPWWGWTEWERFIDWMAMNGINRPLLQCGQEAVWLRVWQDYGLSADQVRAYFSGPAHLPWHRMANLDRWGGPLPLSYIEGQEHLQVQILARVRQFGMKAILSGFAGHVPPEIARIKPQSKITRIGAGWGGLTADYATTYLDPTDPLFAEIQRKFINAQTALYGTDHLYAADPFNEMAPPSYEPAYLAAVSKGIFAGMAAADADARWYQMAWTYYDRKKEWNTGGRMAALLGALPPGRLVMLDYVCEEEEFYPLTNNFFGQPFIWNYLGNFGGNTNLVAPMHKVSERLARALRIKNCAGVGSTLEGINVNPVIYEMVLEQPWHPGATLNLDAWISDYAAQRAQHVDPAVADAWHHLAADVLVDQARGIGRHGVIFQCKPPPTGPRPMTGAYTRVDYPPAELVAAIDRLLQADRASRLADGYQFDVVNLTRQALGNYGKSLYAQAVAAYAKKDLPAFRRAAAAFLEVGRNLDELLGTRHEFLLGPWLAEARHWGRSTAEADYYETSAREIITSWQLPGKSLDDYASRQYNGLLRTYYLPRWEKFFALAEKSLEQAVPFPEAEFTHWMNETSARWVRTHGETYRLMPQGDPVSTAEHLFHKYRAALCR